MHLVCLLDISTTRKFQLPEKELPDKIFNFIFNKTHLKVVVKKILKTTDFTLQLGIHIHFVLLT